MCDLLTYLLTNRQTGKAIHRGVKPFMKNFINLFHQRFAFDIWNPFGEIGRLHSYNEEPQCENLHWDLVHCHTHRYCRVISLGKPQKKFFFYRTCH